MHQVPELSRASKRFSGEEDKVVMVYLLSARGLGLADLDFESVCPVLLGLMEIWQRWPCSWAILLWNTQIKVTLTQVHG